MHVGWLPTTIWFDCCCYLLHVEYFMCSERETHTPKFCELEKSWKEQNHRVAVVIWRTWLKLWMHASNRRQRNICVGHNLFCNHVHFVYRFLWQAHVTISCCTYRKKKQQQHDKCAWAHTLSLSLSFFVCVWVCLALVAVALIAV